MRILLASIFLVPLVLLKLVVLSLLLPYAGAIEGFFAVVLSLCIAYGFYQQCTGEYHAD